MSVGQSRLCLLVGRCSPGFSSQWSVISPAALEGRRHLTTNPKYKKPYPYKEKSFGWWRALTEYTSARINENSRILLIEGLPCVGKSEFAKNLADNFKLKYMPPVSEEDIFVHNGFDIRQLNDMMLSEKMKLYDLDMFYAEPDPNKMHHFAATQIMLFKHRYYQYVEALRHVLHTGQGVVLENSLWADRCYTMNMYDHGYFTRRGFQWMNTFQQHAATRLWRPHLVIHLDAPSSLVVQKLKEKHPKYADSPVIKESYFDGLRDKIMNNYIPYMSEHCETLYYDVTKMEDFDLIAMDLETMDLISKKFAEGVKYLDWRRNKEESYSLYRVFVSDPKKMELALKFRQPYNCPELTMDGEEFVMMLNILDELPQLSYPAQYWGNKLGIQELEAASPVALVTDSPRFPHVTATKQISSA